MSFLFLGLERYFTSCGLISTQCSIDIVENIVDHANFASARGTEK